MLNEKDQALHKGLMKLLDNATFPLTAKEVNSFALIHTWARTIPQNLNSKPPAKPKKPKGPEK